MARDDLDLFINKRSKKNPDFGKAVDDALLRRQLARRLAAKREAAELSQTVVAARMGTSASVVSKLEAGGDVRFSTLQRYCAAVGFRVALEPV
jgi:HTH-type transcriptional regulator / antitoxin HipB